jgi:rare lipoprotein A (peptidoglycan hydrolase)
VALRYHGRTVVVPVIDRGPYARGVSYDLTEATAKKLGMMQTARLAAAPLDR